MRLCLPLGVPAAAAQKLALNYLAKRKPIASQARGFYVIIPPEYEALRGEHFVGEAGTATPEDPPQQHRFNDGGIKQKTDNERAGEPVDDAAPQCSGGPDRGGVGFMEQSVAGWLVNCITANPPLRVVQAGPLDVAFGLWFMPFIFARARSFPDAEILLRRLRVNDRRRTAQRQRAIDTSVLFFVYQNAGPGIRSELCRATANGCRRVFYPKP
jgi:hypothetical protein